MTGYSYHNCCGGCGGRHQGWQLLSKVSLGWANYFQAFAQFSIIVTAAEIAEEVTLKETTQSKKIYFDRDVVLPSDRKRYSNFIDDLDEHV